MKQQNFIANSFALWFCLISFMMILVNVVKEVVQYRGQLTLGLFICCIIWVTVTRNYLHKALNTPPPPES